MRTPVQRTSPASTSTDSELAPDGEGWRKQLHTIIFEADTTAGRLFDLVLIAMITLSVIVVSVETVGGMSPATYTVLRTIEWVLTVLFTIEYGLRLISVRRPMVYAASFFGIVDLLAIVPTWISLVFPGARVLMVVRVLRVMRVFRVLKLTRYLTEARTITSALKASSRKISVFLFAVGTVVIIVGSLMFAIEGPANGFTSIPVSMYWAVVTLTTVGYGDISPKTPIGQTLASFVMILGYGIIAVPTGIVTAELAYHARHLGHTATQVCDQCGLDEHADDATFCRKCGTAL